MRMHRWLALVAATVALVSSGSRPAMAQGLTTGAITGTVTRSSGGTPLGNVQIEIQNIATGFRAGIITRENGRFYVQGLEVGQYRVTARLIGYTPQTQTNIRVQLNLATRVDFEMVEAAATLAAVAVTADRGLDADFSPTRQGIATVINDTLIRRVPTLQRDFTDLVKLTPQTSSVAGQGTSAGGAYNRLNNFTVDGANQNDRFNLGSSGGQPGGATSGRIMSIEAVKEFQVLMSPTDVRYGNFAGMLVNAVTRNGTNTWEGGATYSFRTPQMAANVDEIRASNFRVKNYGFTLGGPIIKDKLHFFVAPEWQDRTDPTTGPILNVGGTAVANNTQQISMDTINEIARILAPRFDVGNLNTFRRGNPLTNLMGRIDWSINNTNRMTFRVLDNTAEQDEYSRSFATIRPDAGQQTNGLRMSSNSFVRQNKNRSFTTQLFSNFASGMANELMFGYNTIDDIRITPISAPEIAIGVVSQTLANPQSSTTTNASVVVGTERFSPGNALNQKIVEISNNLTIPAGSHNFTLGGRYEFNDIYNFFLSGAANGAYNFRNIDSLRANNPSSYAFSFANGGDIAAKFKGSQISAYLQDLWTFSQNFSINAGLRVDVPMFSDAPAFNDTVFAASGDSIRTDAKIRTQALWSPRIGFNWDIGGTQTTQLRGNVGIFTGNTPYILIGNAYGNTGLGGVTVVCGTTAGNPVPEFTTNVSELPKQCGGSASAPVPGTFGTNGVNVNDPDFKYPQNFTTSFGLDRQLPWGVVASVEALYRRDINGLYIRDLNLTGPRLVNGVPYTDANGRVLFADTITQTGSITNDEQKLIPSTRRLGSNRVQFNEGIIQLTNSQGGYNYTLSTQLRKRFSRSFEATAAYAYNQAKDVQSLTSDRAVSNWRFGRQFAGPEYDPEAATTSNFERPNRFIFYGTYTAPWTKNQTDVSFYFEGISGSPITYVTNNDINGDGVNGNDPIYVPRDASDANEFRIGRGSGPSGNSAFALNAADAAAFDKFISMQKCLDNQRGQIMERNSCNGPFQKRLDMSVRQTLPEIAGQRITLQLAVHNFANLINNKWGRNYFPIASAFNTQPVLNTAGRETGALNTALWNYNVATGILDGVNRLNSPFSVNPNTGANNYQIQLTARLAF